MTQKMIKKSCPYVSLKLLFFNKMPKSISNTDINIITALIVILMIVDGRLKIVIKLAANG